MGDWTWNDDPTSPADYFSWAEGEPNINPDAPTNYVQIQQDYDTFMGTWLVPDDQTSTNYYICQSPKIPTAQKHNETTTTVMTSSTSTVVETSTSMENSMCMPGYQDLVSSTGKCYYISIDDDITTWDDAGAQCDSMMNWDYDVDYTSQNTHLVSINSQDENDQLFQQLNYMAIESVWIGLSWNGNEQQIYRFKSCICYCCHTNATTNTKTKIIFIADFSNWTWNSDDGFPPTYFNWAQDEPNVDPNADSNYVQLQQDYEAGGDQPTGAWFVPQNQADPTYYICQSPKVPQSSTSSKSSSISTPSSTTSLSDSTTTENDDTMECMPGYQNLIPVSDKCFFVSPLDTTLSWDDAMSACTDMVHWGYNVDYNSQNTQLLSIETEDENNELFDQLYDMNIQSAWIGLSWNGKISFAF